MPTSKDFIYKRAVEFVEKCREILYLMKKRLNLIRLHKRKLPTHSKGHTYINLRPGQYLTHAHSYITWAVAATDSCFALIGAHEHGKAVGLMNGQNPRLKNSLPRRVQSSVSSARSTQHMRELLAGNRTSILPQHARCAGKVPHELPVK